MSLIFRDESIIRRSWTYSQVNGITREDTTPGKTYLSCKSNFSFTFNQKKNYQFITKISSNNTTQNIDIDIINNPAFESGIIHTTKDGIDTTLSAVKFYSYAKPLNNLTLDANQTIFRYGATDLISSQTYIQDSEINEIDFFINGQREWVYDDLTTNGLTQSSNGWLFEDNSYKWYYCATSSSFDPRYVIYGSNLSATYSRNFIAKIIDYDTFNLELNYNVNVSTSNDMINIYLVEQSKLSSFSDWQYVTSLTSSNTYNKSGLLGKNDDGTKNLLVLSASYSTVAESIFSVDINNINILGAYHPTLNNTLQYLTSSTQYYGNIPLQIPNSTQDASYFYSLLQNNNLYPLYTKVGNGTFKSGIWENGVWNNGWRDDEQARDFDQVALSVLTNTDISWKIELRGSTQSIMGLTAGDKVAIGNIVAIDINDNRKLLKDYYTIERAGIDDSVQPSYGWIRVNLDTTFPYRRIEKDSPNHKIKVTKNIWLSGGFFNGYFSGVWNNGLFKGLPLLTEMYNTHWIDGYFNGGHFNSVYSNTYNITNLQPRDKCTNGYIDLTFTTNTTFIPGDYILSTITQQLVNQYSGTSQVIAVTSTQSVLDGVTQSYDIVTIDTIYNSQSFYNFTGIIGSAVRYTATGLIQNFNFYDSNRSLVKSTDNKISSQVFSFNSWIDVNYDDSRAVTIGRDFRMYEPITKKSITRNNLYGYPTYDILSSSSRFRDSNTLDYKLYKLGTKYRVFNNFIGVNSQFNEPFNDLDFSQFINAGWTYSSLNTNDLTIKRTETLIALNDANAQSLIAGGITGDELYVTASNTGLILNNNLVNLEKKRYSVVEFDLMTYSIANNNFIYENPDIYNIVAVNNTEPFRESINSSIGLITSTYSLNPGTVSVTDVVVTINLYGPVAPIVINLKSPNGEIINLKKNGGGIGNRLANTKFSLRDKFTKFSLVTTPYSLNNTNIAYQDTYQYDAELNQSVGSNPTSSVSTLAGLSASISGIWTLYVEYPTTQIVDLTNWSISVEHLQKISTNIEPASKFPILHLNNLNYDVTTQTSGYDTVQTYKSMSYLPINKNIDHLLTTNTFRLDTIENMTPMKWGGYGSVQNTKKYEYFYNKTDLMISILGNGATGASSSSIILDNINIYETDMIPFFKYFQDENIYKGIQIPFVGEAPNIDYLSSDFVFIDNITISVDTLEPGNGITNSCVPTNIVVSAYTIDFLNDVNKQFNLPIGTSNTTISAQVLNNNIIVSDPIEWSWTITFNNQDSIIYPLTLTSVNNTVTITGLTNGGIVKLQATANINDTVIITDICTIIVGANTNINISIPSPKNINFSKTLQELSNSSNNPIGYSITESELIAGYSNSLGYLPNRIVITSLPTKGQLTYHDVIITSVPFTIILSDLPNNLLEFYPINFDLSGNFETFSSVFNYIVLDGQSNASSNVSMNMNFTAIQIINVGRIAQLNSDLTIPTQKYGIFNDTVYDIYVQYSPIEKLIAVGNFTSFTFYGMNYSPKRVVRFDSIGNYYSDYTFNNPVLSIIKRMGTEQYYYLGGSFINPTSRLSRLRSDETIDTSFSGLNSGFNNDVNALAIGLKSIYLGSRIYVGGKFTNFNNFNNGTQNLNIGRFGRMSNLTSLDTGFNWDSTNNTFKPGFNNEVKTINVDDPNSIDHKILVGGLFTTYNGISVPKITRLDKNGAIDTTFRTLSVLVNFTNPVTTLLTALYGVSMTINTSTDVVTVSDTGVPFSTPGGQYRLDITLNNPKDIVTNQPITDFSISVYDVDTNQYIDDIGTSLFIPKSYNVAIQRNYKFYINCNRNFKYDSFSIKLNVVAQYTHQSINNIGSSSGYTYGFNPTDSYINVIKQKDGFVYVGGSFASFNGYSSYNSIIRLELNGRINNIFGTGFNNGSEVNDINFLSDGSILVGGKFDLYNGQSIKNFVKLNPDGSYNSHVEVNERVRKINTENDKIVIVGDFTTITP